MDPRIFSILSQHPTIFADVDKTMDDINLIRNMIVDKLNYYNSLLPDGAEKFDDLNLDNLNLDNVKGWISKCQSPEDHPIYKYNFDQILIAGDDTELDIYIKCYRMMDNMMSIYTMNVLRSEITQPVQQQQPITRPSYEPVYTLNDKPELSCHVKVGDICLKQHFKRIHCEKNSIVMWVPGIGSDLPEFSAQYEHLKVFYHFFDYGSKSIFSNIKSVIRNAKVVRAQTQNSKIKTKPKVNIDDPNDRVNRLADLIRAYTNMSNYNYVDIHCDSHGTLVTYRAILLLKQMGDAPNLHKVRIFAKSPPRQLPKALVPMGCINFYHNKDGFYKLFKFSRFLRLKLFDIPEIKDTGDADILMNGPKYTSLVILDKKLVEPSVNFYDLAYLPFYLPMVGYQNGTKLEQKTLEKVALGKQNFGGYYHVSLNMLYPAISQKYFEFLVKNSSLVYDNWQTL